MQIKLYGNGHSCNIPVQEIIDKYWKDETAPFSFEMSTAIGDETIAATAMLGEESPDTYPSMSPFPSIGIRKLRSIPINAKSTSSLFTRKRMAMISTWSLKWMTLNTLLFLRISRRSSKILSGNP